jgi:hypothetical protein
MIGVASVCWSKPTTLLILIPRIFLFFFEIYFMYIYLAQALEIKLQEESNEGIIGTQNILSSDILGSKDQTANLMLFDANKMLSPVEDGKNRNSESEKLIFTKQFAADMARNSFKMEDSKRVKQTYRS